MSEIIAGQSAINAEGRQGMEKKYLDLSGVIEEAFIMVIVDRVQSRGITHSDFALAIWPEVSKSTARSRWREMRNYASKTGRRMSVTLEHAVRMAGFFGEDLCYLLCLAQEVTLNGNRLLKHESVAQDAGTHQVKP